MLDLVQLLLLENLTYTYDSSNPFNYLESYIGYSLKTYIEMIPYQDIPQDIIYNSYMNGKDWYHIFQAISLDPVLLNLKIIATHRDNIDQGGGGFSMLLIDQTNKEAIVVFKGTQSAREWEDNFQGASKTNQKDYVSTIIQQHALTWYQEIYQKFKLENYDVTIIGHSKGGNKASYITLLDPTVKRGIAFDGQGFSDHFLKKYHNEIEERKHKLINVNLHGDFVNILLNDVGETYFYEGFEINSSNGGFVENHCPNSFFDFSTPYPTMHLVSNKTHDFLYYINNMLNALVRAQTIESVQSCIDLISKIYIGGITQKDLSYMIDTLNHATHYKDTAYILAFIIEYIEKHPESKDYFNKGLDYFQLTHLKQLLNIAMIIINSNIFDSILSLTIESLDDLPEFILNYIHKLVYKKTNQNISIYQIMFLIDTLQLVPNYQRIIQEIPDGKDQ